MRRITGTFSKRSSRFCGTDRSCAQRNDCACGARYGFASIYPDGFDMPVGTICACGARRGPHAPSVRDMPAAREGDLMHLRCAICLRHDMPAARYALTGAICLTARYACGTICACGARRGPHPSPSATPSPFCPHGKAFGCSPQNLRPLAQGRHVIIKDSPVGESA